MSNEGVTINISKDETTTNGDSHGQHFYTEDGERVIVHDSYPSDIGNFYKVIHTPDGGKHIDKIKQNDTDLTGFNADLDKYPNVAVYFFLEERSEGPGTPLIIQFGDKDIYYVYDQKDNWKKAEGINSTTLANDLLKQRCKRNKTHKIELSRQFQYNCPICEAQIEVERQQVYTKYSLYKQYIAEEDHFSVSSFVIGNTPQTGITLPKEIENLYVYFHPSENGSPLIIYVPPEDDDELSNKGTFWKKSYRKGTIWEREEKDISPSNPSEDPKIVEIIGKIPETPPKSDRQTSGVSPEAIAGISCGVLGSGAAISVGIWRGPAIVSALKAAL
ncbi:hypothetical protein BEWA_048080 [Theileria equi strain WA]|uniref:Uncharacterized protein n=1 Tax=Theileria equi strain WA TaxID=1537102 RepID=L1LAJ9_THEEQ|nr:hypothetical protein BEWA_048080 [Theileria equi strain WA]EKX72341.1 hypothetical protein BEWA_048080 [Theileria equi strain WA]|eukprot:XP_004831793.1 hypothetical protein BEWA_048080 [Theileria equi strain WA]